jgi:MarR family 2-MHQ and catechol resistance regulon transcriptional repressor
MGTHHRGTAEEVGALDAYIKLLRAANTLHCRLGRGLRGLGLTESQLGVLEALYHLGPLHQHELGGKLLLSRANVSLIVDVLTSRRLVRRERSKEDRRRMRIQLTAEGRRRLARVFPQHVRSIVGAFSCLSPREQRELGRLCRKLGRANQL